MRRGAAVVMPKEMVARERSRTADAAGKQLEGVLEWIFVRLEASGRAWIRKTNPPTGIDAAGRRFFKQGAPPDYFGALSDGRLIVFDAKGTSHKAFDWRARNVRHDRTKRRQIDDLHRYGQGYGALAGLLVVFRRERERWGYLWVPWTKVPLLSEGTWTPARLMLEAGAVEAVARLGGDPGVLEAAQEAEATENLRRWGQLHKGARCRFLVVGVWRVGTVVGMSSGGRVVVEADVTEAVEGQGAPQRDGIFVVRPEDCRAGG